MIGRVVGVVLSIMILPAPAAAQSLRPGDVVKLPSKPADFRIAYGSDPVQFGDLRLPLHLPRGKGPFPVAIVIHGGCWLTRLADVSGSAPIADALRDAGVATWNIEYRRADHPGGGWPGTFTDVATAADHLRVLAPRHNLDLSRVVAVGHSAGGHLAFWLAGRGRLPARSAIHLKDPLKLRAVVSLGYPGEMRGMREITAKICGDQVIDKLFGGTPEEVPERYAEGSPGELLPLGTRQMIIAGVDDPFVPAAVRDGYIAAARKRGDSVDSLTVPGRHFEVMAPPNPAWLAARDKILELAGVGAGGSDVPPPCGKRRADVAAPEPGYETGGRLAYSVPQALGNFPLFVGQAPEGCYSLPAVFGLVDPGHLVALCIDPAPRSQGPFSIGCLMAHGARPLLGTKRFETFAELIKAIAPIDTPGKAVGLVAFHELKNGSDVLAPLAESERGQGKWSVANNVAPTLEVETRQWGFVVRISSSYHCGCEHDLVRRSWRVDRDGSACPILDEPAYLLARPRDGRICVD